MAAPGELALTVKEGVVLPRRLNCPNKVPGGILTATATGVKAPIHTKLTFRLKYKARDGDRQTAHVYEVSHFP
jgi:hypothetical protein